MQYGHSSCYYASRDSMWVMNFAFLLGDSSFKNLRYHTFANFGYLVLLTYSQLKIYWLCFFWYNSLGLKKDGSAMNDEAFSQEPQFLSR